MNKYSLLLMSLVMIALILSACGPRRVDQVQPIKFEYTHSEAVARLPSLAHDFHPQPGRTASQPAHGARTI